MGILENELHDACKEGDLKLVKSLLKKDINLNEGDFHGRAPLIIACSHGHTEIVRVLLEDSRIDVNQSDEHGRTAFYFACWIGRADVVQLLLKNPKVDVNQPDTNYNWTPLIQASYWGYLDVVQNILASDKKVKVDATNKQGKMAHHFASDWKRTKIVNLLNSYSSNPRETRFQLRMELGLSSKIFFFFFFKKTLFCLLLLPN